MDKSRLIDKGNELIDMISQAMTAIEITDRAKEKVMNDAASICITIPIEDTEFSDQYNLAECLPAKAIENIKTFITAEIVKAQDEACHTLERMGLRSPAIVNQDFEQAVDKMVKETKKPMPDRTLAADKISEIQHRSEAGESNYRIAKEMGLSATTVAKYIGRSAK